ncbi:MAG TPA: hypothetical protein VFV08_17030, partial [Puia sp.]|nr:hypothetical protein [Puia sp.]
QNNEEQKYRAILNGNKPASIKIEENASTVLKTIDFNKIKDALQEAEAKKILRRKPSKNLTVEEFVQLNGNKMTLEQIKEELGLENSEFIRRAVAKFNITLPTRKEVLIRWLWENDNYKSFSVPVLSLKSGEPDQAIHAALKEMGVQAKPAAVDETRKLMGGHKPKHVRAKAVYTQTGSKVLDELRGIQTTKREPTLITNTI